MVSCLQVVYITDRPLNKRKKIRQKMLNNGMLNFWAVKLNIRVELLIYRYTSIPRIGSPSGLVTALGIGNIVVKFKLEYG